MSESLVEKIKQVFSCEVRSHVFPWTTDSIRILKQIEKEVLKILSDYDIKPYVLTLCDKCNKEFQMEFEETASEWVKVFARCPHCNNSNHRWLKIPKNFHRFCQACIGREEMSKALESMKIMRAQVILSILLMFPKDEVKAKAEYQKLMKRVEEW